MLVPRCSSRKSLAPTDDARAGSIGIGHDVMRYYRRAVTIVDTEQLGLIMRERLPNCSTRSAAHKPAYAAAGSPRPQLHSRYRLRRGRPLNRRRARVRQGPARPAIVAEKGASLAPPPPFPFPATPGNSGKKFFRGSSRTEKSFMINTLHSNFRSNRRRGREAAGKPENRRIAVWHRPGSLPPYQFIN
jgi:hypothetical protein